ncbi:uncharacterized protein LOC122858454 isoform X4 [Aphidius gifuensis]|uniref:uncharacterized protein LOC122858454 isoform X4 n=1 Tax=Aphidius gifuensis TaxID=684658 RepID=UPI001CDD5572|nr:uncharacterized protein LOC122858454 isoform X4 [Aphidius gifuensis]
MFLESNWTWLTERWGNMADLAERVDDLICTFDSSDDFTMDTLSMLIFGWMLFGLIVLCLGKYIYNRFILSDKIVDSVSASVGLRTSKVTSSSSSSSKEYHGVIGGSGSVGGIHGIGESVVSAGSIASKLFTTEKPIKIAMAKSASSLSSSSGVIGSGGVSSSGVYIPPTPPVRKRITRKTSGPLLSPARSSRTLHLPAATGADCDAVRWVNELIVWLHSDYVILNELLATWVISLNEFVASSVDEQGVGVEFVRVLPETQTPILSNIFCECDTKNDITITCDCEATPALQLKAFRQKGDKVEISHYRVNVNRFRARLNILCITEKLLLDVKCDGWPEVKVSLAQVGTIKKDLDESQLQEVVIEIVTGALRGTNVHFNLSKYPTCPRLWRESSHQSGFNSMPVHYDGMTQGSIGGGGGVQQQQQQQQQHHNQQYMSGDRRLLVKVVRANDLGGEQGCSMPLCVVELDEPPQKHQTAIKKETSNPVWDEAFLFDVTHNTSEVLIEIYDNANKNQRFLGLGIVGVEELLANPSQRQIIPLQARPYEADEVTGTLTVEFLFIEGAEVPQIGNKPFKVKETIKPMSSPTRTYSPTNQLSNNSLNYNNGNSTLILYDSSVQSTGDYLTNGSTIDSPYRTGQINGNKGTLIVHSQQRQIERQILKVTLSEDGSWQELSPQHANQDSSINSGPESTPNSSNSEERGRTRRKRRDFFGTIKKRLSRSKTRSRSAGPNDDPNHEDANSRSISADRAGSGLLVPGREEQSRRSSLSEASAISGTSTRTYINEASTLVLETLENGIKKHYLVPLSLAQKSKWRKKGTKLHVFNDHTFIAKHMTGGTVCEVCKRTLARRLGKQGYECRDCLLKCHKHCHVKVDTMCSTSTIQSIELICIRTPKLERKFSTRRC